jgi:hypothetical protein
LDRPISKGKEKGHNYIGYWHNHKETKRPTVAGFREYLAADKELNSSYYQHNKHNKKAKEYPKHGGYVSAVRKTSRLHIFAFQIFSEFSFLQALNY